MTGGAGAANDVGLAVDASDGGLKVVSLGAGRNDPADMDVGRAGGGGGTGADTGGRGGARDLCECNYKYIALRSGNGDTHMVPSSRKRRCFIILILGLGHRQSPRRRSGPDRRIRRGSLLDIVSHPDFSPRQSDSQLGQPQASQPLQDSFPLATQAVQAVRRTCLPAREEAAVRISAAQARKYSRKLSITHKKKESIPYLTDSHGRGLTARPAASIAAAAGLLPIGNLGASSSSSLGAGTARGGGFLLIDGIGGGGGGAGGLGSS